MSAEQDSYYNLAERIEDAFPEIDSDISTDLSGSNDEYAALQEEVRQLQPLNGFKQTFNILTSLKLFFQASKGSFIIADIIGYDLTLFAI